MSLKQKKNIGSITHTSSKKKMTSNKQIYLGSALEFKLKGSRSFQNLVQELREKDKKMYKRYFRMNEETFQLLVNKIKASISKEDAKMRKPIPPEERLRLTLRFLATGKGPVSIDGGKGTGRYLQGYGKLLGFNGDP